MRVFLSELYQNGAHILSSSRASICKEYIQIECNGAIPRTNIGRAIRCKCKSNAILHLKAAGILFEQRDLSGNPIIEIRMIDNFMAGSIIGNECYVFLEYT